MKERSDKVFLSKAMHQQGAPTIEKYGARWCTIKMILHYNSKLVDKQGDRKLSNGWSYIKHCTKYIQQCINNVILQKAIFQQGDRIESNSPARCSYMKPWTNKVISNEECTNKLIIYTAMRKRVAHKWRNTQAQCSYKKQCTNKALLHETLDEHDDLT
jgi:hypothetical protein